MGVCVSVLVLVLVLVGERGGGVSFVVGFWLFCLSSSGWSFVVLGVEVFNVLNMGQSILKDRGASAV